MGQTAEWSSGPENQSIFVIPVLDRWLLFAPLHRVSAIVNRAAVRQLRALAHPANGRVAELSALLEAQPDSPPGPRRGVPGPPFLGLIPTRTCNLNCVYCGFGAAQATGESMDVPTAVAAVDWMAGCAQRLGRETLDIHFFGGEPFLAGDLVDVVVHRARFLASAKGLLPRFEAATNGVYDEARARFIGDYFDTVVLSFDGPREVHDMHRPMATGHGSFEVVARTARILSESPAGLCFRVCVTAENVGRLEETVRWFSQEFGPSTIDFETLQPTPESEKAGLHTPDPCEFAGQFFRARRAAGEAGVAANYAASLREAPRITFCPVGNDGLIVSPGGSVGACYLPVREWQDCGLDLHFGRVCPDAGVELDLPALDRLRRLVVDKPRCRNCFCQWSCAGGCHVKHSYPGCPLAYDDFCIQTRLITAASVLVDLDAEPLAQALLASRPAMETLALRVSDRLSEWEDNRG